MTDTSSARFSRHARIGIACLFLVTATRILVAEPEQPPEKIPAVSPTNEEQKQLLDRIVRQTTDARDQLRQSTTQQQTQDLQQGVITDLEALIELLKQSQPPPPKNSDNPFSNSDSDSPDSKSGQNSQKSPKSESKSEAEKSKGTGTQREPGRDREQPADSEEREGESRAAKLRAERQLRLENDIWGHLPPNLRDQLLNTYGERMLPQYEEYVRKFYDALSEPGRKTKPR